MALKSKPLGFSHQGIREPLIIWYKKIRKNTTSRTQGSVIYVFQS